MIYYPLTTLMQAGIKEKRIGWWRWSFRFKILLGNGSKWWISIKYAIQEFPKGIAQALIIGENFLDKSSTAFNSQFFYI